MERSERFGDLPTALLKALEGWQAGIWTALPCTIVSFNAATMTCQAQPLLQGSVRQQDGTIVTVNMPLLLDVPVIFPGGGGFTLTFPIAAGDEALVVFASRCIDSWWQLGPSTDPAGPGRPQAEIRMHDLSDGFAIVGPRSLPRALSSVSTTATQLRSDDGATMVEVSSGKIRLQAAQVEVHATASYRWDVNGYGQKITYAGGDVWNIDSYTTPVLPQVVNTFPHTINPPEVP